MVQGAFVSAADVHPWLLADGFQPLQFAQFRRIISLRCGGDLNFFFGRFKYLFVRHKNRWDGPFWPSNYATLILRKLAALHNVYLGVITRKNTTGCGGAPPPNQGIGPILNRLEAGSIYD